MAATPRQLNAALIKLTDFLTAELPELSPPEKHFVLQALATHYLIQTGDVIDEGGPSERKWRF